MIRCIAIHMSQGGTHHAHIAEIRWTDQNTGETKQSSRAVMVQWVNGGGQAFVQDSRGNRAFLRVRNYLGNYYVQTYADGIPTDNLLHLPRY